jgi:transposase InsO family protein
LASPPGHGELRPAIDALSERTWIHPATGALVRFSASTIETWLYRACNGGDDPIGVLRKKVRTDAGVQWSISGPLREVLRAQHGAHATWSYQLHYDNVVVSCEEHAEELGEAPSYSTVRRFMKLNGLFKQRRIPSPKSPGALRARARLESAEVRSYEVEHVHGLWHTDFHQGSLRVLLRSGEWHSPQLLAFLDDHSRVCCHAQWYLDVEMESFVHGLSQGLLKRGLPRTLMSDGGSAMRAAETQAGLSDLSIVWSPTLPYSPYQNGKQENFWTQVEGRLLAMLEGVEELTLAQLNEATQAWVELEYNRKIHSEIGVAPVQRMIAGPSVVRTCPGPDALRHAFRQRERRTQRRSDGTVSIEGVRFEVPSRLRHLERLEVRYARWDLSSADVVDPTNPRLVIGTLYPLDKASNADGVRRALQPSVLPAPSVMPKKPVGVAPLLGKLIADYRATGLPPAYLPKHDLDHEANEEESK